MEKLIEGVRSFLEYFSTYVDYNLEFKYALKAIAFNPIFWNIAARLEYYNQSVSKLVGHAELGCFLLASIIFWLGIYRDNVYYKLIINQPTDDIIAGSIFIKILALFFFIFGKGLVVASIFRLGFTGTYLGDYFGILMDKRITGFPFNVTNNPMYNGSSLCFLAAALWYGKPSGILVSIFIFISYRIALLFEEPFTAMVYAKKEERVEPTENDGIKKSVESIEREELNRWFEFFEFYEFIEPTKSEEPMERNESTESDELTERDELTGRDESTGWDDSTGWDESTGWDDSTGWDESTERDQSAEWDRLNLIVESMGCEELKHNAKPMDINE